MRASFLEKAVMAGKWDNLMRWKGKISVGAIVVFVGVGVVAVVILRPWMHRRWARRGKCRPTGCMASRVVCGTNVYGIGKALTIYAGEYEGGRLPLADKWCDFLVQYDFVASKQFICRKSEAIVGESSYAINKNVAGKELAGLDPNVVLVFETDFGKDAGGRQGFLKNRAWYKMMPYGSGETRVYEKRWNQAGGAEILTTKHHDGKGCFILFGDGHVEFVRTEDLGKLKWK